MEVRIESLMAYEDFVQNPSVITKKVDSLGEVFIIKDNRIAYRILKVDTDRIEGITEVSAPEISDSERRSGNLTLRQAVKKVLQNHEGGPMHVSVIADILYHDKLYTKRDGSKAHYTQVRAMCGHYPDDFLTLSGNMVELR